MPLYKAAGNNLSALVAADGLTGGFIKDSQAGTFGLARLGDGSLAAAQSALLVGTATNDNAAAGQIGEVISSTVLIADKVPLANGTPKTITSIILTPGDWDVWGNVAWVSDTTTTATSL